MSNPQPMPVRKATITVDETVLDGAYEGWEFEVRLNPPFEAWEHIASGEFQRLRQGFSKVILNWNGLDEAGEPLPPPASETIGLLPLDLIGALADLYTQRVLELPKA